MFRRHIGSRAVYVSTDYEYHCLNGEKAMKPEKLIGAAAWIMMSLTFSAIAAPNQPQKSIAEIARENREARLRKAAEETVKEMCSRADDPKVQETYPKIKGKCKDERALIQAVFEIALRKSKEATEANVKRTQDALANETVPSDSVVTALSASQASTPSSESRPNDVESLEAMLDSLSSKTSRELAYQFAGETQFPGRDAWEQRLDTARNRLVAKTQVVINLINSKAPSGALNNALYDMKLAQVQYSDVQADGISKAADWKKQTERNRP